MGWRRFYINHKKWVFTMIGVSKLSATCSAMYFEANLIVCLWGDKEIYFGIFVEI